MTTFRWNPDRDRAALLVAQDRMSDEQIAAEFEVSRQALAKWKTHPDFQQRVEQHRAAWRDAVMREGIADKVKRIRRLNDTWERLQRVVESRAESMPDDAPGTDTGLLVRQIKSIGFGENNQTVEEYAVDTGLLKELREVEKQAAQELGQWVEKSERTINIPALREEAERIARELDLDVNEIMAEAEAIIRGGA